MATFKKDWKAGDRPVSADANRWETNTEEAYNLADSAKYWATMMHISGCVGGNSDIAVESGSYVDIYTTYVGVKPRPGVGGGTILSIRMIGFNLDVYFRLRVFIEGETKYFESQNEKDYYDAFWAPLVNNGSLYTNFTDAIVRKKLIVRAYNTHETQRPLSPAAGFSFQLSGVADYADYAIERGL
jgi:hypothetical protein